LIDVVSKNILRRATFQRFQSKGVQCFASRPAYDKKKTTPSRIERRQPVETRTTVADVRHTVLRIAVARATLKHCVILVVRRERHLPSVVVVEIPSCRGAHIESRALYAIDTHADRKKNMTT